MLAANALPVSIAQRTFKLKVASTERGPFRRSTGWDYAEQTGTKCPESNADLARTPHNPALCIIGPADVDPVARSVVVGPVCLGDDADALGLEAQGDDLALEFLAGFLE
jgi:hypothetical protein